MRLYNLVIDPENAPVPFSRLDQVFNDSFPVHNGKDMYFRSGNLINNSILEDEYFSNGFVVFLRHNTAELGELYQLLRGLKYPLNG